MGEEGVMVPASRSGSCTPDRRMTAQHTPPNPLPYAGLSDAKIRRASPVALLMILTASLILAGVPVAGEDVAPTVMVKSYTVNPTILSPEGYGSITVKIQQIGKFTVKEHLNMSPGSYMEWNWPTSVYVDRVSLEGNSIKVISPPFDHIGELGPEELLILTFTIQAPVKSGMYYPEVRISSSGRSVRYPVPVNVNSPVNIPKQAIIIMSSALPESVNPGDEVPVTLTLTNEGGTLADKVTLKIDNQSADIAPKTSASYYVGEIGPGESRSLDIALLSDRNTDPGLVRIPVNIQYTLADGTVRNDIATIDLVMRGEGELGFVSVDTSPKRVTVGQPFDLIIRIENTGTGPAKQVSATVDLPMTGVKKAYIGKIEPGNDAPATFLMDGGAEGSSTYNVTVSYSDDTGPHTETFSGSLRITREDPAGLILLVLLVAIAGGALGYWFWYLPRKHSREQGNGQ